MHIDFRHLILACPIQDQKFNFSIPFSTMERLNEKFGKNITQIIEQEQKRGNATLNREQILDFTMNKAGQSPMLYRKAIIEDY